jgi:CheY-like chemotaxis protein
MALILVVDDEDYLQRLIGETLNIGGHKVVLAGSGKEASLLCKERVFDLVITDLVMPDMDGLELIRCLRASHNHLPILAISGAYDGVLKIAAALGAAGTLKKPFGPDELSSMVDQILGRHSA